MNTKQQFDDDHLHEDNLSLKDYINILRLNIFPIMLITIAAIAVAVFYAITATDIYSSTTTIKIRQPHGNILEAPLIPEFQDYGSDRFIANEIEVMKSFKTRERVAEAYLDTFRQSNNQSSFYLIYKKPDLSRGTDTASLKNKDDIAEMLTVGGLVSIEQKRGLDIVEITVESPSQEEAALLTNLFAQTYYEINLEYSRKQLISVREFLGSQRQEKMNELLFAEEQLKNYQEERGVVDLTQQSRALIEQLTDFEAKRNATKIELTISKKSLDQYREELENQDPRIRDYLESFAAEPYIKNLQSQIAQLQSQKDLAIANITAAEGRNDSEIIRQYNQKIEDLRAKLNDQIKVYKAGIFASNPEQIQELTQKVLEEEVKYQSLVSSLNELNDLVDRYEQRFEEMPKRTLDLARLQRQKEANEKLYLLVEEKYQEAQINERSTPGNVLIIDAGRVPESPAKPNRKLIVALGVIIGLGLGFGFAFVRNYFDNTVKTPEDLQNKNISLLAWIPEFAANGKHARDIEFIVHKKSDSTASEAYRALRTRIKYSGIEGKPPKKLLITSSSAGEGKTTTAINLAGSFAQTNQKTLVIDCDLRKPRLHKIFNQDRYPGFIDYFFEQASFGELLRKTPMLNLFYITGGTIPPNPAEIVGSQKMEEFIKKIENQFDVIIFDSPPLIAVTDSEILSQLVDGVILVVSSGITEIELLYKSLDVISMSKAKLLGTVLNNFSYRPGYGAYYKYYYYYQNATNGKDRKKITTGV